jgi:hypothetical protein
VQTGTQQEPVGDAVCPLAAVGPNVRRFQHVEHGTARDGAAPSVRLQQPVAELLPATAGLDLPADRVARIRHAMGIGRLGVGIRRRRRRWRGYDTFLPSGPGAAGSSLSTGAPVRAIRQLIIRPRRGRSPLAIWMGVVA